MELTLLSSPNDDVIRVRSFGPVSTSAAHDPLTPLIGEPSYARTVLLFLDESRGIDTSGVCWLVNSNKRFTEAGGKLVLVAVPPGVHDTLEFLHLIPLLNIVPNEQAVCELLSAPRSAPHQDELASGAALPAPGDNVVV